MTTYGDAGYEGKVHALQDLQSLLGQVSGDNECDCDFNEGVFHMCLAHRAEGLLVLLDAGKLI